MESHFKDNQSLWDEWTKFHIESDFYDVEKFKSGQDSLDKITSDTFVNLSGESLLHLQCHFGLDTLSLARRGAKVTGVDFSEEAIKFARSLSIDTKISATFIQCNIFELSKHITKQFDIVFTSHGVLCWLPNLDEWAKLVFHFLKPGGLFYILEVHPFALLFDKNCNRKKLSLHHLYFGATKPIRKEKQGTYAIRNAPIKSVSYLWFHRLDNILGSLIRAGLRITSFEEYPYMNWQFFQCMEKQSDGFWRLSDDNLKIPLMFSIKAKKD